MIRVLVAEDSLTARTLLLEILSSDPEIQVVGQAKNGFEAVELATRLRPDLVTMDVHMPEMDGLQATKEIMIAAPTPIVLITGSSGARGVEGSMHALRAGALEVMAKPPGPGSPGFEEAARKLIATVKAMSQVKVVRHFRPAARTVPVRPAAESDSPGRVVAIATSTGGPAALLRLLEALPGDFAAPILVVQHISPGFAPGLVSWLNTVCDLHVKLAEHGEILRPHTVYLAPDGQHLGVSRRPAVSLSDAPPVGGFRPSGTALFESVARVFGAEATAVILTGMGQDGVAGLRAVRQAGGRILAQDEQSCVVYGMPGAAVAAGVVDEVLSLEDIAARLTEIVGRLSGQRE
jgi:two-component system chemotaxis response regulator CheB